MRFLLPLILFVISTTFHPARLSAQSSIKGKIINQKNGKPISFASVRIPKINAGQRADASGMFILALEDAKKSDTFFISSIGFATLKIPVAAALDQSNFYMTEQSRELENVVVKSYTNEGTYGAKSEITGYYKSWRTKKSGGEIGKIFTVGQDEYKVEKIRFKINNQCDVCNIRLRIRNLEGGLPGRELFRDSISTTVKKLSADDMFAEFDLTNNNIVLKERAVFISLELENCQNRSGECSFCYVGTESGNYIFRKTEDSDWQEYNDYNIYMRLYFKY